MRARQWMNANGRRWAVVTGASSGIGAAYARSLAARGLDVVLTARRERRLADLAEELRGRYRAGSEVVAADLTEHADVERLISGLGERGPVAWLVNAAGLRFPGRVAEVPVERSLEMIDLHILSATRLTRAVLPGMIDHGDGEIVNVASIGAFIPNPGDATYCATKAYRVAFSRAVHAELAGTGVEVQALCPGFTHTEFYEQPVYTGYCVTDRIPRSLWMSTDATVEASLAAFQRGRVVCIPGLPNRLLVALARTGLADVLTKALDAPRAPRVARSSD